MIKARYYFLLILVLGCGVAKSETAYVTDELRLTVHRAKDTSDKAFANIKSGDAVEILERNRSYARVRLEDGRTGWVRVAYLVDKEPARRRVQRVEAERDKLAAELVEFTSGQDNSGERIATLEKARAATEKKLREQEAKVASLSSENAQLLRGSVPGEISLPVGWLGGLGFGLFVAGWLLSAWWTDRRMRRRHGGFRIQ